MCGIVGGFSVDPERIAQASCALRHRGPDADGIITIGQVTLAHRRLSIVDLDARSNQPIKSGQTTLVMNGEVWNYRELRAELAQEGCEFITHGDGEVMAAALDTWGPLALIRFDGMFAVAWTAGRDTLHIARDRFGEVPVHIWKGRPFTFASELKGIEAAGLRASQAELVGPGEMVTVSQEGIIRERWYEPPCRPIQTDDDEASALTRSYIATGVRERSVTDVPVCTLLSGGIDSSAVAYHLRQDVPDAVAFVAVMDQRSRDLRCAREVATALDMRLIEVVVPEPTAEDLACVVEAIELDSKAQVEIGWPCLHLAQAIRAEGFKVAFSGEGSDELWASYGFAYHGIQEHGWHKFRKRLFLDQAHRNFVRCNKAFMTAGVECRLPFLNSYLVEYALSLPQSVVQRRGSPKDVMRRAYQGLLPRSVTDRQKLAFQDGIGIKKMIAAEISDPGRFYRAEYRRRFK